jgi:hypothetical protein
VKQVLRQANGSFDERTYGFAGLMDLLRACQRDGVLRMERDRRGALRVFPGSQISAPARETTPSSSPVIEGEVDESATPSDQPAPELPESTDVPGFADFGAAEEDESSAHITDTTAEMLARAAAGDATARRRKPAGSGGRGRRTGGTRTATARPGRSRPRRGSSE